jgi:hypothetical protein
VLCDNDGHRVGRFTKKLKPCHHGKGINWGIKLTGRCTTCGREISERETFVHEVPEKQQCRPCWLASFEGE